MHLQRSAALRSTAFSHLGFSLSLSIPTLLLTTVRLSLKPLRHTARVAAHGFDPSSLDSPPLTRFSSRCARRPPVRPLSPPPLWNGAFCRLLPDSPSHPIPSHPVCSALLRTYYSLPSLPLPLHLFFLGTSEVSAVFLGSAALPPSSSISTSHVRISVEACSIQTPIPACYYYYYYYLRHFLPGPVWSPPPPPPPPPPPLPPPHKVLLRHELTTVRFRIPSCYT
ncbi:hypothetical protein LY76DRAFT_423369 [Colletotrichum caudatum]|nr:hypothetical protein LY76DRAFT_423369 [Colletotrichum caudatum]